MEKTALHKFIWYDKNAYDDSHHSHNCNLFFSHFCFQYFRWIPTWFLLESKSIDSQLIFFYLHRSLVILFTTINPDRDIVMAWLEKKEDFMIQTCF